MARMRSAQLRITKKCVNVNLVIQANQRLVAKSSISAKVHLAQPEPSAKTIVDLSNVSVSKDSSVTRTTMDVKNLKNVKSIMTALKQQSAFLRMDRTSAKMFVRILNVASTLIAFPEIMQPSASAVMVSREILKIVQTDVNKSLRPVLETQIVQQTLTVMASSVSQLVAVIRNAHLKKFALMVNV